jgi:hypothetical protein
MRSGARYSQDTDVVGSLADALLAGVCQFDGGSSNLDPSVNLDNLSQDRFHQIERTHAANGQQVGARRCLIEKIPRNGKTRKDREEIWQ